MKGLRNFIGISIGFLLVQSSVFGQCILSHKFYNEETKILYLESMKKQIYYDILTQTELKIRIDNTGIANYALNLYPFISYPWTIDEGEPIDVFLVNGEIIKLDAKKDYKSSPAKAFLDELVGAERYTGQIECDLSEEQFKVLNNHGIKQVKVAMYEGVTDFSINDRNESVHLKLIECVQNKLSRLKQKYPDAIRQNLSSNRPFKNAKSTTSYSESKILSPIENIYSKSHSLNKVKLQIAFGFNLSEYFLLFRSIMSNGLDISPNNVIKILLSNDEVLMLKPYSTGQSNNIGEAKCSLSFGELKLLRKHDIVSIRIQYSNNSVKDYELKAEKKDAHRYLIEYVLKERSGG